LHIKGVGVSVAVGSGCGLSVGNGVAVKVTPVDIGVALTLFISSKTSVAVGASGDEVGVVVNSALFVEVQLTINVMHRTNHINLFIFR
jgi:hypothetical protein